MSSPFFITFLCLIDRTQSERLPACLIVPYRTGRNLIFFVKHKNTRKIE